MQHGTFTFISRLKGWPIPPAAPRIATFLSGLAGLLYARSPARSTFWVIRNRDLMMLRTSQALTHDRRNENLSLCGFLIPFILALTCSPCVPRKGFRSRAKDPALLELCGPVGHSRAQARIPKTSFSFLTRVRSTVWLANNLKGLRSLISLRTK